jgi:hypothetical protein
VEISFLSSILQVSSQVCHCGNSFPILLQVLSQVCDCGNSFPVLQQVPCQVRDLGNSFPVRHPTTSLSCPPLWKSFPVLHPTVRPHTKSLSCWLRRNLLFLSTNPQILLLFSILQFPVLSVVIEISFPVRHRRNFHSCRPSHEFPILSTTEYTELKPLLFGVHSVMRVKLALAGEGGGAQHAHPLSLHLTSPVKLQCTLQLSGQTH